MARHAVDRPGGDQGAGRNRGPALRSHKRQGRDLRRGHGANRQDDRANRRHDARDNGHRQAEHAGEGRDLDDVARRLAFQAGERIDEPVDRSANRLQQRAADLDGEDLQQRLQAIHGPRELRQLFGGDLAGGSRGGASDSS